MELAPVRVGARDLHLRRIRASAIGRRRNLVAPRFQRAAHVPQPQIQVAQPLARLERFRGGGIALDQLPVLLRGAAGIVEVQGAEIAGQLERSAAHRIGRVTALLAELEKGRARLDQRRFVMSGEREVARLLELCRRAAAASAERKGGEDCWSWRSSRHRGFATSFKVKPQRLKRTTPRTICAGVARGRSPCACTQRDRTTEDTELTEDSFASTAYRRRTRDRAEISVTSVRSVVKALSPRRAIRPGGRRRRPRGLRPPAPPRPPRPPPPRAPRAPAPRRPPSPLPAADR